MGRGKGQGKFWHGGCEDPTQISVQPPPYLRDKVKITLPHLKEEISAETGGGGQPLTSATEIQNRCGNPAVQHLQAPPLPDAPPLNLPVSLPRAPARHC